VKNTFTATLVAFALLTAPMALADGTKPADGLHIDDVILMRFWVGNKVVDHAELDFGNSNLAVYGYSGKSPQLWLDYAAFKPLKSGAGNHRDGRHNDCHPVRARYRWGVGSPLVYLRPAKVEGHCLRADDWPRRLLNLRSQHTAYLPGWPWRTGFRTDG